jgi:peptidoglycan/LPS O-acetylase OafA/YrhL
VDRGPELPEVPGLDGLRALALGAVLVFSQGFDLGRGGFLGTSSAFTLSGFLLATLALAEWSQTSQLALARFWERRARRLAPALLLTVLAVVALQSTVRVGSVPTFRGDVIAALGYGTNWRLAFPAEGFARSFNELSALRHLWPVAIAAQVFLVFPLLFKLMMWITGRQWRLAGILWGAGALVSFSFAWAIAEDPDARDLVYYGTHTRVGELLVGVVLGYAVLSPSFRKLISRPRNLSIVRSGALGALVGLLLLWTFVSFESSSLFHGITALNALLTAWVILAVTMPGPVAQLLGIWPLRQIGQVSYAAYLFHWPIYLLIDEDRIGLDGAALFGVRVAATLGAAIVSYWAIETPVRWRLRMPRFQLGTALAAGSAALVALVFVVPVNPPANISLTVDDGSGPGYLDVVTPTEGQEAARVLLVGDEIADSMIPGFQAWNADPDRADQQLRVDTHITAGCPLGGARTRVSLGRTVDPSLDCEAWRPRLPKMLEAAEFDVIVVVMGVADLGSREIGGDLQHLGNAGYDHWLTGQIDATADVLAEADVPVLWATTPHVRLDDDDPSTQWPDFDDNDPRRVDLLNELTVASLGQRDGFTVIDLNAWLLDVPRGEFNPDLRTGSTFTERGATSAVQWLAPQVLDVTGSSGTTGETETTDTTAATETTDTTAATETTGATDTTGG